MAMSIILGGLLFIGVAVGMYFFGKFLPKIVTDLLDLVVFVWLLSILLSTTAGVNQPQQLLESIPMVEYLVTFEAGSKLGQIVANLF